MAPQGLGEVAGVMQGGRSCRKFNIKLHSKKVMELEIAKTLKADLQ